MIKSFLFTLITFFDLIVAPKPPNIALIIVDDLAVDGIGAYRSAQGPVKTPSTLGLHKLFEHIPTPALDKLAEEGVLFTRAYTSASICSPSRYSLLVGKYPSRSKSAIEQSTKHPNAWKVTEGMHITNDQRSSDRVGDASRVFVYNHFNVWIGSPPKDELTMAHALQECGYRTGMVGKWHLSWRQADPHACSLTANEYEEEKKLVSESAGFDYVDALHTCNIQSSTKKGIRFSHNPEFTLHYAQKFVNESQEFNKPWFLYMGLTLPHPPNARLALTKYDVKDTPAGINKFNQLDEAKARRNAWRISVAEKADEAVNKALANGYKGSWEKNSHNSASIIWLDAIIEEWIKWLTYKQILENTLIVFTADHGLMGKRTCNEHGIRIPMIFRGPPQLLPRNVLVHQLVALHDLAATFLHVAQVSKVPSKSASSMSGSGKSWSKNKWKKKSLSSSSAAPSSPLSSSSSSSSSLSSSSSSSSSSSLSFSEDRGYITRRLSSKNDKIDATSTSPTTFLSTTTTTTTDNKNTPFKRGREAILEGDGVSIWPTIGNQPIHESLVCETGYDRAIIGLQFKYITRKYDPNRSISSISTHRATTQLYNLSFDPNELDNYLIYGEINQLLLSQKQHQHNHHHSHYKKINNIYDMLYEKLLKHIENTKLISSIKTKNKDDGNKNDIEQRNNKRINTHNNNNTYTSINDTSTSSLVKLGSGSLPGVYQQTSKRDQHVMEWLSLD